MTAITNLPLTSVQTFPMELVNSQTQRVYSVTHKLLGKGGFGCVREGVDCLTGSPVGIKTQKDSAVAKTEAVMARTIQAPHLVPCRTAFEIRSESFLVMDLINEVNIPDAFFHAHKTEVKLTPRHILTITQQSLEFLAALRRQDIVYFDLKPTNMIFRPQCGSLTFIDLGGARKLKDIPHQKIITTPLYCAPEYYLKGELTPAFDLCSLGITLYALCTGFNFLNWTSHPKDQRGNYLLQSMAQRIGKPSAEFLKGCKKADHYFNTAGDFRQPVSLPPILPWEEMVKTACQKNAWPTENITPFVELLRQLLRYENRTPPEELLKSSLFQKEIATHLEYDRRQKCKIYLHRASVDLFNLSKLNHADLKIDLSQSVDPCLHIPRDPQEKYVLILEKEGVSFVHHLCLKDRDVLDIKKYQDELTQRTNKAKRDLSKKFEDVESPHLKKSKQENISPQSLDFGPAFSTRARKPILKKNSKKPL